MGREIRRVPPDWQHPKEHTVDFRTMLPVARFRPLHDETVEEAQVRWDREKAEFEPKEYAATYEEYAGPRPAELYHRMRSWTPEEATHFQVYETVSEGTPVSPVLESIEAVIEWAVGEGYSREAAEAFAKSGWAPSLMLSGGVVRRDIEAMGGPA